MIIQLDQINILTKKSKFKLNFSGLLKSLHWRVSLKSYKFALFTETKRAFFEIIKLGNL
jgi:hypothetical protein